MDSDASIGRILSGVMTFPCRPGTFAEAGVALIERPLQAGDFIDRFLDRADSARQRSHRSYLKKQEPGPSEIAKGKAAS